MPVSSRRVLCATALVLAAACAQPSLQGASGDLTAAPAALAFPRTFVGHPTRASVRLSNRGRAARVVHLATEPPWSVGASVLDLPGGGEAVVQVEFAPAAAGAAAGRLRINSDSAAMGVPLSGLAELVPACVSSSPCRASAFDPAAGGCVEQPAAEGESCADSCLERARCNAGACVGTGRSCDDANACTRDLCSPATGCVHLPQAGECPQPTEPCRAAVCDPRTGCGSAPAPDGTPCGESDCRTAHLCWSGTCVAITPPDGFPCGAESPCQERGVCRAGACDQPPPHMMEPVWTYEAAPGRAMAMPGIADDDGNTYWSEQDYPAGTWTEIISADARGRIRFRHGLMGVPKSSAVVGEDAWDTLGHLILWRWSLLSTLHCNTLEALDVSDGSTVWAVDLLALATDGALVSSQGGPPISVGPMAAGPDDSIYVVVNRTRHRPPGAEQPPDTTWLLRLDLRTRSVVWRHATSRHVDGLLAADVAGNLFFVEYDLSGGVGAPEAVSLGPDGSLRWRTAIPNWGGGPAAVAEGNLVVGHLPAVLLDSRTGVRKWLQPLSSGCYSRRPMIRSGRLSFLRPMCEHPDDCGVFSTPGLFTFDVDNGTELLRYPLGSGYAGTAGSFLLEDGSVLLGAEAAWGGDWSLRKINAKGVEDFRCPLPARYHAHGSLAAGVLHLIALRPYPMPPFVQAFSTPGLRPASRGWVALGASMSKDWKER